MTPLLNYLWCVVTHWPWWRVSHVEGGQVCSECGRCGWRWAATHVE